MSDIKPTVKCPTCRQAAIVDDEHLLKVPFFAECRNCNATFFVHLQAHLIKEGVKKDGKKEPTRI